MQRLVLDNTISEHKTAAARSRVDLLSIGATGIAVTDLRPSGRIKIDNTLFDATTTGQWISQGSIVRIMHTGMTLEVEELKT
jgi:membrane-bound serine protease (ClpP class)